MASVSTLPFSGLPGYLALLGAGGWAAWNVQMVLAGLAMFFLVTFIYMIALAFNLPTIKAWCKSEYMQVLVTFILIGSVVAMTTVIWPMMLTAVVYIYNLSNPYDATLAGTDFVAQGGRYIDPFQFAVKFLDDTIVLCQKNVYRMAYSLNLKFEFYQTLSNEPVGTEPLGGWYASVYVGIFKYIAGSITNGLMLNYVQMRLLMLIKYAMPPLILIGMVLRTVPITRGAGGLLLALGFGFFFVYPITVIMLMTLTPVPNTSFCTGMEVPPLFNPSVEDPAMVNPGEILFFRSALMQETNAISGLLESIKNFVPVFYLQGFFFPIVSLIVTFTFIRQTSAVFGADLNEIGRGLIKLI